MKNQLLQYTDYLIILGLGLTSFSSAISVAGSSIGLGLAFIGWLSKFLLTKEIHFNLNQVNKAMIIFLFTILISFIDSYNLKRSLDNLENYILLFIFYNIIITSISDLEQVKRLFSLSLISILISAFYGFIWQHHHLGISRIYSTFMPLDFGALILIYLLFSMIYLLFGKSYSYKRLKYFLLIPILFITFIYNKTRGAWLGFVGASSITFWLQGKKWVPLVILLVIVVILFAPNEIKNRVSSITDLKHNRSNLGRLALWKGAILMFKDHPINGIGLGNFREIYMSDYKQPNTVANSHAHNTFLHLLAETGIVGFGGLIYLLYSILKYLYINYLSIQDNYSQLFILATFGAVIGVFIIQGFTETNFDRAVVARTMWFIIGLSTVIIENNRLMSGEI